MSLMQMLAIKNREISYVGGLAGVAGGGFTTINVSLSGTLTGGSNTSPAAGDVVILAYSVTVSGSDTTLSVTDPAGYTGLTEIRPRGTSYNADSRVYYKVMSSNPDTYITLPLTSDGVRPRGWTVQVFRNVSQQNTLDVTPIYASESGVDNLPNPGAITPITKGSWIVVCGTGSSGVTSNAFTANYLSNFVNANYGATNSYRITVGAGYFSGWTSGTYDPAKFGGGLQNDQNSWSATTLVLRPL